MAYKFYPDEVKQLDTLWCSIMDLKSDYSGSAYGEHYKLADMLKDFGVKHKFESSSQLENYVEYVITYGEAPDVF